MVETASSLNHLLDVAVQEDLATEIVWKVVVIMRVLVNVLAIIMCNYMQIDGRNVASTLNHLLDVAVQEDLATEIVWWEF